MEMNVAMNMGQRGMAFPHIDPEVLRFAQEIYNQPDLVAKIKTRRADSATIPSVLDSFSAVRSARQGVSIPINMSSRIADMLGEQEPDIMVAENLQRFLAESPDTVTKLIVETPSADDILAAGTAARLFLELRLYWSSKVMNMKLHEFLAARKEAIRSFAANGSLPEWHSPAIARGTNKLQSRLPAYPTGGKPCLLFHRLHDQSSDARELFSSTKNVLLINAPGCGKSRLVLSGLSERWGIYFVSGHQSNFACIDQMGSKELHNLINITLPNHPAFTEKPSSPSRFLRNRKLARRCFQAAILARLLIMDWFLQACEESAGSVGSLQEQQDLYRLRWLSLQAFPSLLESADSDIFNSLTIDLLNAPGSLLRSTSLATYKRVLARIRSYAPLGLAQTRLFCVVDEAQLGSFALKGAFKSDKPKSEELRPALCEIFKAWMEIMEGAVYVITGTGIDRADMIDALTSVAHKNGNLLDRYHTGGFDELELQKEYVMQFIPTEYWCSDLGKKLLWRIWYWLRGRYRHTTAFVEALLEYGYEHAHKLLTDYVQYSALFRTTDGDTFIESETQLHLDQLGSPGCAYCAQNHNFTFTHHVIDFGVVFKRAEALGHELHFGLANIVYPMVTHARPYWHKDAYIVAPKDQLGFIRHGIARVEGKNTVTRDQEDDKLDNVTINEPLTLGLAVNFLKAHQTRFQSWSARNVQLNHKTPGEANGFETYLALYFALQFADWRELSHVFHLVHIRDDQNTFLEALSSAKARLVARCSVDGLPIDAFPSFKDVVVTGSGRDFNAQRLWSRDAELETSGNTMQASSTSTTDDPYSSGAAIQLGCLASESSLLFEWLNGELGIPMCFPGTMIGPDLMFCLELKHPTNRLIDGKRIWVAVQAKHYDTDKIGPDDFLKALSRVSPSRMCTRVVGVSDSETRKTENPRAHLSRKAKAEPGNNQSSGRKPTKRQLQNWKPVELEISGEKVDGNAAIRSSFAKLLKRLSLQSVGLGPDDFTVLRVVAAFPSRSPETIQPALAKKDPLCKSDNHPIAILNREHFIDADKSGILKQLAARHRDKHSQLHPPSKRRRPNDSDMEVD